MPRLNLLYANDEPGAYPKSWYADTAPALPAFPALEEDRTADVCVVGGGYTGLSAALQLAEAGLDVVLLEAQRVGFGASGRNGGQLGSGQRVTQDSLEPLVGKDHARHLWAMGQDAKALVKSLIERHAIECDLVPGVVWTGSTQAEVDDLHAYASHLDTVYGYRHMETLDAKACMALCPSPDYRGGIVDWDAAHLHPLKLALGLARAAETAGVHIHERSAVSEIIEGNPARVVTTSGTISARHVVLACNGYMGSLNPRVAAHVMPINNFIVATEPLGDRVNTVLTQNVAVADSKFVVNYFRLTLDGRLLFGGGESYGYRFPSDIAATVRKPMSRIFPHLADVPITHAWGGTLAITMKRLPYLARVGPNILSASGYSGHGVGTATHAGQLMAQAILGESAGFDTMARIPTTPFPGGARLRSPLLALAMTWYALRDRLGI
ncbi:FAD-binding oxidoreductase [Thalassococcus sp. S3]|uniref:NAD(P)/FAD-dependent oxidoreductase n=1 Tax=Thalassococcus sp. S3 TaxID=2017482 RepID=UPI0010246249|nr:FAD-binding oxidoreductase [Thalassococcus sp. S3]QBF32775.1 FAD-dependent oxidoreductase [Thalassococcus sp. S3]